MRSESYERVKRLHIELRQRADRLSDRSLVLAILGISAGLLIPLIVLFSALLNSFLGGATLLAVLTTVGAFLMRAHLSH